MSMNIKDLLNRVTCNNCNHRWENKRPDWYNQDCPKCGINLNTGLITPKVK